MLFIARLTETAKLPTRATEWSAGLDLYADETVTIAEYFRAWVSTGISVAIDPYHYGRVSSRSGLSGHGWDVGAGTIDADYRGEVKVLMINNSPHKRTLHAGERIAQLLIIPIARPEIIEMDSLPGTERGENGFGSTGQ